MNQLFWKFFIAFWLGLVMFATASLWAASSYLDQTRNSQRADPPRARFLHYMQKGQQIANRRGRKGVESWLQQLDFREAIPFYLLNQSGEDLLKRSVPDTVEIQLRRNKRHLAHQPNRRARYGLIHIPNLGAYRLVPDHQGVNLTRILKRPRVIALPLLIAALSSALICFLLARYLVRPINQLRRATQRVSRGDFNLSVADKLNSRRDEIGELAHDFDHMTEQLKVQLESQQQLLRDVSHELRSPLARLQLALGLLQKKSASTSDEQMQAQLTRVECETEKMNDLIGQILSLTRIDAPQSQFEPIDLCPLITKVVEDANFEAGQQRVVLDCPTSVDVSASPLLLASAIENVIRNALKYSPEDQLVKVRVVCQQAQIQIKVIDQGPGVPESQLKTIFKPFARLDEARHSETGGYGVGLALAQKIMQKHHGEIYAQNRAEGGLCVVLGLTRR